MSVVEFVFKIVSLVVVGVNSEAVLFIFEAGLAIVQQHTAADTSPHNKEAELSSPRITQHKETDGIVSSLTRQNNASFESELKEISLNVSLESEWTTSSPVASVRNNSQAKSRLKSSPGKDTGHTTTRSQSERSQRKKQTFKQRNKRQASLENINHGHESHPNKEAENMSPVPPPLQDGFMIPYTRTTSATFHAVPDTPSSHPKADLTTVNKPTLKKPQSVVIPPAYRTTNQPAFGRHTVRKDNMIEKTATSGLTGRQGMAKQDSKKNVVSKTAEMRKVKHDKAKMQEEHPRVYPAQVGISENFSLILFLSNYLKVHYCSDNVTLVISLLKS